MSIQSYLYTYIFTFEKEVATTRRPEKSLQILRTDNSALFRPKAELVSPVFTALRGKLNELT